MNACLCGHLEVLRALLDHERVNVNIMSNYGITALDVARGRGEDDFVRLLEEHVESRRLVEEEVRRQELLNRELA